MANNADVIIIGGGVIGCAIAYDLAGGNAWSKSFQRASVTALGQSLGAHSVRHTFAQERMSTHMDSGKDFEGALRLTSQELGHFRPEIALAYLR